MARPIDFPEAQGRVITSKSGVAGPLPVKELAQSTVSCWELTSEEKEEIQTTGRIWVTTSTFSQLPPDPSGERWQPILRVTTDSQTALSTEITFPEPGGQ